MLLTMVVVHLSIFLKSFVVLLVLHESTVLSLPGFTKAIIGNNNMTDPRSEGKVHSLMATDVHVNHSAKPINPYKFSFILEADPCTVADELLIVVHMSAKVRYSNRRMVMRATWLSKNLLSQKIGLQVKIVFFAGTGDALKDQKRIEYESELYKDIVQSNFSDSYKHNTYKLMSYLRWTSLHCAKAKLLLKIDDDALLRTKQMSDLNKVIQSLINSTKPIYAGKPVSSIPQRNVKSKWYVSREAWPEDRYPMWFQGLIYFLSPQHMSELFNTALHTHYMHTDDVFLGIIVSKTATVRPHITAIKYLSEFAPKGFDVTKTLKPKWMKGLSKFFHIPVIKTYYLWALEDLRQANMSKSPWFQW